MKFILTVHLCVRHYRIALHAVTCRLKPVKNDVSSTRISMWLSVLKSSLYNVSSERSALDFNGCHHPATDITSNQERGGITLKMSAARKEHTSSREFEYEPPMRKDGSASTMGLSFSAAF